MTIKLAILNDTHAGVRNSSEIFIEYQRRFYEEVFFPYCNENGIKQIIHLGDYYENRKFINFGYHCGQPRFVLEELFRVVCSQ
jgi:metallophosphoesterase superfamily enzyme